MVGRRWLVFALLLLAGCQPRDMARMELLWPDGAPRARGKTRGDTPRVYVYPAEPAKSIGIGVVVASGGSYGHHLGLKHEGVGTARWLNAQGITAFVTRYRVGWSGRYNHVDFIGDGKRAVRKMRSEAAALGIDPDRIGMIGYSAGGHLAASIATQCPGDEGDPAAADPIDRASCRVSWAVPVYPVISQHDAYAHRRSRSNLVNGIKSPSAELLDQLSPHTQVGKDTTPMFVVTTRLDTKVDWRNSQLLYDALVDHGVTSELLVFEDGRHGIGVADDPAKWPQMSTWPSRLLAWLRRENLL